MVLFNTMFPISESLSICDFLTLVKTWLTNSKNYHLDISYPEELLHGSFLYECAADSGNERLTICRTNADLAVQLIRQKDRVIYQNTYILTKHQEQSVCCLRLERQTRVACCDVPVEHCLPKLMRMLFWQEYGGDDNGLLAGSHAHLLQKGQVDFGIQIVKQQVSFLMPVVYVSPQEWDGTYQVNYEYLAHELIGQAHIVVEGSPCISELIGRGGPKDKPKNGEVGVYLPGGEFCKLPSVTDASVIQYVHDVLANTAMTYCFSNVRIAYLMEQNQNSELSSVFDEVLNEKDVVIRQYQSEIEELRNKVFDLTQNLDSCKANLQLKQTVNGSGLMMERKEVDLYPQEVLNIVLSVLTKEVNFMKGNASQEHTRKYRVLKDLVDSNAMDTEYRDDVASLLRSEFENSKKISTKAIQSLKRLGFDVAKGTNNHYEVAFAADDRYKVTISSTASDVKSNTNMASTFMNTMFGY